MVGINNKNAKIAEARLFPRIGKKRLYRLSKTDLARILAQSTTAQPTDFIPLTAFSTSLSPLQAITRYLISQGKTVTQIAKLLGKARSSIAVAAKSASLSPFVVAPTSHYIPLILFTNKPTFSILEGVVYHLQCQHHSFSAIARLLNRDPRTIWTVHQRAVKKLARQEQGGNP